MRQLSLDNLRTFVAIADLGSFQKAGDLLGRTQPAISLQMKKLEEQLGKRLFEKRGQSYRLNREGSWLYNYAKRLLAINDEIFSELEEQKLRGRLRLGIPSEFASTILPSIVGEFAQRYPDVTLEITSALSRQLLSPQMIDTFDLILALTSPEETAPGEIVVTDALQWVGDPNLPLPADNIPLVVAPDGCIYRSRIIEKLKTQTHAWKITFTNADLYGLIMAIQQGLGITALAKSSIPKELVRIKDKRLPPLGKINISLVNRDTQHPQISEVLGSFIKAKLRA